MKKPKENALTASAASKPKDTIFGVSYQIASELIDKYVDGGPEDYYKEKAFIDLGKAVMKQYAIEEVSYKGCVNGELREYSDLKDLQAAADFYNLGIKIPYTKVVRYTFRIS